MFFNRRNNSSSGNATNSGTGSTDQHLSEERRNNPQPPHNQPPHNQRPNPNPPQNQPPQNQRPNPNPPHSQPPHSQPSLPDNLRDYGPEPLVVNIRNATLSNNRFRNTLWTGKHLQITLMTLRPLEDIGLEMHRHLDQMLVVEQGYGKVLMGNSRNRMSFEANITPNFALVIPAGTWHNIINVGGIPLKMYSVYAPPEHPFGTIHNTRQEAMQAHEEEGLEADSRAVGSEDEEVSAVAASSVASPDDGITDTSAPASNSLDTDPTQD